MTHPRSTCSGIIEQFIMELHPISMQTEGVPSATRPRPIRFLIFTLEKCLDHIRQIERLSWHTSDLREIDGEPLKAVSSDLLATILYVDQIEDILLDNHRPFVAEFCKALLHCAGRVRLMERLIGLQKPADFAALLAIADQAHGPC